MSISIRTVVAIVLCAVLSPMLGGCGCKSEIVSREVRVTLDDSLRGKPVEVNFYAANGTDLASWSNVPVDDYFKDSNEMRSGNPNKGVLSFDAGGTEATKVFSADEKIWAVWKQRGGWDLVILADIPGSMGAWKGDSRTDPRRQVVPLNSCLWEDPKEPIRVQVHPGSITIESQFRSTPR